MSRDIGLLKHHQLHLNSRVDLRAEALDCCGMLLSRLFKIERALEKFRSLCVL